MLTREQCRNADRIAIGQFQIPGIVLMENAGRSCAEKVLWHIPKDAVKEQAIVILCGPGNNGGDGFVIARHLYNAGLTVKVVLFRAVESYVGDAKTNLEALAMLQLEVVEFDSEWNRDKADDVLSKVGRKKTTWVIDALLGTGAQGEPRGGIRTAIESANHLHVHRMAVDIPTGLDADSGKIASVTFVAGMTCTFIEEKIGFQADDAKTCLGHVAVVDIGLPDEILGMLG